MKNPIDSIVNFFSARRGFKRLQYRLAADNLRGFEGASQSRRTGGWRTQSTSANTENQSALEVMRNRSRDLVRNNPYANRAVSLVQTNTVGKGIMLNIVNENPQTSANLSTRWAAWAGTTDVDYDNCMNFNSMQALVMRSVAESGEILIRRRRVTLDNGTIGIKLQVLESDHLVNDSITPKPATEGNRVIQGVEIDPSGKPVAYHLWKNHPGNIGLDIISEIASLDTVVVPADDIIHVFKKDRPGQLRGMPWLSNTVIRLRELDEFEDAMLVRQKIAACFSAFVFDSEAPETLNNNAKGELDIEKLEPGSIEYLPPGKDIKFGTPPLPQGEAYKFYVTSILQSIAVGIGVSYEALTGNLSEVNFSSARMGWLEFGRNIDSWRSNMLIPQFCDRVFLWFLEAVTVLGEDVTGTTHTWTPPRREMIDPTKEVPARIRAVRAGIETLSDSIRENGKEPDRHFEAIKADNDTLDRLDLTLDTDPRKVTAAGMFQVEPDPPSNEGES